MRRTRTAAVVVASSVSLCLFVSGFMLACKSEPSDTDQDELPLPDRTQPTEEDGGDPESDASLPRESGSDVDANIPPPVICTEPNLSGCFAFENDLVNNAPGGGGPTNVQDVTFTDGVDGRAVLLGATSFIRSASAPGFNLPVSTIEAWVRPDQLPDESVVFDADERFSIAVSSGGVLYCRSGGTLVQGGSVKVGQWTHVACVADGTRVRAYVDGVSVSFGTAVNGTHPTAGIAIGGNAPSGLPFIGAIDSLRLFSVARTATEISNAAKR